MHRYVALLRGINVGGARRIPMKELRGLFGELGLEDVTSYVASGNLVFRAAEAPAAATLQTAIGARFGHADVPVVVLTAEAFRSVADANPYADAEPSRAHVGFLGGSPAIGAREALAALPRGDEELTLGAAALYLHAPSGMARTKLTSAALERCLGVPVTLRNLRTVRALYERCAR
ncbi:MAG: DUF1697 domain-containing protein [Myxococcota bacterium]